MSAPRTRQPRAVDSVPQHCLFFVTARYDRLDRGNGLSTRLALLGLGAGAVIFDSLPHHKHVASSIRPGTI
jgi:hypothetical protein